MAPCGNRAIHAMAGGQGHAHELALSPISAKGDQESRAAPAEVARPSPALSTTGPYSQVWRRRCG